MKLEMRVLHVQRYYAQLEGGVVNYGQVLLAYIYIYTQGSNKPLLIDIGKIPLSLTSSSAK